MKECELYPPVREWLQSQGYEVHVEIFDCDVIGLKDDHLIVVELKTGHYEHLRRQLADRARWADEVLCAVPVRPKDTRSYRYCGYGVLLVQKGKCRQIVKPRQQPWFREKQRKYRLGCLRNRLPAQPHELAGLPSCKTLREQRLLRSVSSSLIPSP